jgi:hypothetical protein
MKNGTIKNTLQALRVRALLYVMAVVCLAAPALSQQEARFDADKSYNAAASQSYDAVTPEQYMPSRRPAIEAAAKASLSGSSSLPANTLRAHRQVDPRAHPAGNTLMLFAQRPGRTFTSSVSAPHSAIYSAALNQRKATPSTLRRSSVPGSIPAYVEFRSAQPKPTPAQPHVYLLNEPDFGIPRDTPSGAAAWNSTPTH